MADPDDPLLIVAQCTVTATEVEWLREPDVAVTVTLAMPARGIDVDDIIELPLQPPIASTAPRAIRPSRSTPAFHSLRLCFLWRTPANTIPMNPNPVKGIARPSRDASLPVKLAIVYVDETATFRVEVCPWATVLGLSEQVVPAGDVHES